MYRTIERLLGIVAAVAAMGVGAAELRVGPGEAYKTPSEAFGHVKEGDTVRIAEGTYKDVCYCPAVNNVTVRGAGKDKTIVEAMWSIEETADGVTTNFINVAGGKGVWVIQGTGWTVDGVTFRYARQSAYNEHNLAGIRYEGHGDLCVTNCSFMYNDNGILCGELTNNTVVTIADSLFRDNGYGDGYTHNIYIGVIDELIVRDCISDHAFHGHDLKSRARKTVVENCVFDDGHDGRSSYLLNCPQGGEVIIRGCRFVQSEHTDNARMISIADGDGVRHLYSVVFTEDNAFVNYRDPGNANVFVGTGVPQRKLSERVEGEVPVSGVWTYGSYEPSAWRPSAGNVLAGRRAELSGNRYSGAAQPGNDLASLSDGRIPADADLGGVVGLADGAWLTYTFDRTNLNAVTLYSLWTDGTHDGMYVRGIDVLTDGAWYCIAGDDVNNNPTGVPRGDCGRPGYDDESGWGAEVKLSGNGSSGHLYLRFAAPEGRFLAKDVTGLRVRFRGLDNGGTGFAEIEAECKAPSGVRSATARTEVPVPYSWLERHYPKQCATDAEYEALAAGNGANGRPVWESYLVGLDPTDAASQLLVTIRLEGGAPVVGCNVSGEALAELGYVCRVKGKAVISDAKWSDAAAGHRFFKVFVERKL